MPPYWKDAEEGHCLYSSNTGHVNITDEWIVLVQSPLPLNITCKREQQSLITLPYTGRGCNLGRCGVWRVSYVHELALPLANQIPGFPTKQENVAA